MPNVTDWQYLNLNYVAKARIDQELCIHCGRCFAACEDTSHQAIAMLPGRVFEVKDDECVACHLVGRACGDGQVRHKGLLLRCGARSHGCVRHGRAASALCGVDDKSHGAAIS